VASLTDVIERAKILGFGDRRLRTIFSAQRHHPRSPSNSDASLLESVDGLSKPSRPQERYQIMSERMSALQNLVNTLSTLPGFGWLRASSQNFAAKRMQISQQVSDYQAMADGAKQAAGEAKSVATGKKSPEDDEQEQPK
jgi:hypothetical protein